MDDNYISPEWKKFKKKWILVAIILFIICVLLALIGYGPWGNKCDVPAKVVEKETLVDNPEHLARIAVLEKENALIAGLKQENEQIQGLKNNIAGLEKSAGLVEGLQAKIKLLEGVDLNFENPKLMNKINLLETENASIADLKKRIIELEATNAKTSDDRNLALSKQISDLKAENALIAGLQAKVDALEAIDINFIKPQDNTALLQKINGLEVDNLKIPVFKDRIQSLEAKLPVLESTIGTLKKENSLIAGLQAKVDALEGVDINFIKPEDNTALLQKINGLEVENLKIPVLKNRIESLEAKLLVLESKIKILEKENSLIPGLKAKVTTLENVDVNFIQPEDNTELLAKISGLEKEVALIPGLRAKLNALESVDVNFIKPEDNTELLTRISALEKENVLLPGLKAKVIALEAIDINFIKPDTGQGLTASSMKVPDVAKLYFEPGSSRFPTDTFQSMADVIVYLRDNQNARVSLVGYHDETGNANWNRRLANKRSNRAKQILLDAGVPEERISVLKPSSTLGSGTPEEARRVEITVLK